MEISAILMGQRVRSARKAKEMSTEELAEKVGVAVESIGHIECGARKPSLNLSYNQQKHYNYKMWIFCKFDNLGIVSDFYIC